MFGRKRQVEEVKPVEPPHVEIPHVKADVEIYSEYIATVNVVREEIFRAVCEFGRADCFYSFSPRALSCLGRKVTQRYMMFFKTASIDFSKLDELTIEELVRINRNLRWNWVEFVEFAESAFPGVSKRVDAEDALNCLAEAELDGRLPEKQREALLEGDLLKYYELRFKAAVTVCSNFPPLSKEEKAALRREDVELFNEPAKS